MIFRMSISHFGFGLSHAIDAPKDSIRSSRTNKQIFQLALTPTGRFRLRFMLIAGFASRFLSVLREVRDRAGLRHGIVIAKTLAHLIFMAHHQLLIFQRAMLVPKNGDLSEVSAGFDE